MSAMKTPTHSAAYKVWDTLRLKNSATGANADFIQMLADAGISEADRVIDGVTFGLPVQQNEAGTKRALAVYVWGENAYHYDPNTGFRALVCEVDFLLANNDRTRYLKYMDCLIAYLESMDVGFDRNVVYGSVSHADKDTNERVTLVLEIDLEPRTDGEESDSVEVVN